MEELICKECKGRKFRKINGSEYECEYCGAIIKDTSVGIVQEINPKPKATPFPAEISFAGKLREGINTTLGKLIIYPDRFVFVPVAMTSSGNLSPREWNIIDIAGYINCALTKAYVKMKDGTTFYLEVPGLKIIEELESRRKYWVGENGGDNSQIQIENAEVKNSSGELVVFIVIGIFILFLFFVFSSL
ncbi:MAG: hypothetical protein K2N91_06505 [Muribaculaceae bacterium]|nr:hypothetical protein [Muribaculaceae bacterium]